MKARRFLSLLLITILTFSVIPLSVSANSPPPSPWYDITVANLPEGTVYVDLLIPLPKSDPMYTELVETNLPEGFPVHAEIIGYAEDDFRSYTFHYRDALSMMVPREKNVISFFGEDVDLPESTLRSGHKEDVEDRGEIRLAMLDAQGNIIKVSPTLPLQSKEFGAQTMGNFSYDALTDRWEIDTKVNFSGMVLYFALSCIGVVLTCVIEWAIATIFFFDSKTSRLVLPVNLVSQVVMRVGFVLLYGLIFHKFAYAVIVLEILVYTGEYFWYRSAMKDISGKKVLLFTVVANTVTLILGYRLNEMLIYHQ